MLVVAVERERRHQKHRQMIMTKYEGICHICEEPFADAIDHVVPVARGGSDHPDNLRPAHTSCNSSKGARSIPAWAESNPNMWLREYEPAKVKAKKAKDKQQREKREQRSREVLREQKIQVTHLANVHNAELSRLLPLAKASANSSGMTAVEVESVEIISLWDRVWGHAPMTPEGMEVKRLGRFRFAGDAQWRPLVSSALGSLADLLNRSCGLTLIVGFTALCPKCKRAVIFDRMSNWGHVCDPRWRSPKRLQFAQRS